MVEVSNNVLAGLLIVAILISVFGVATMITETPITFTGLGTAGTGLTNLTLTGVACLQIGDSKNLTDFGSAPSPTVSTVWLSTETNNTNGFNNGSEAAGATGTLAYVMVLENCGSVKLNVSMNSTKNATTFMCGSQDCSSTPSFFAKAKQNETGSCNGVLYSNWANVNQSGAANNLGSLKLCDELLVSPSTNTIKVSYNLSIPINTFAEAKSATVNYYSIEY